MRTRQPEECLEWATDAASKRQFEGFAAETSDTLFRTGYLMTGDLKDAEDLVQETFLRVARRWSRVQSMEHPAAYARRILINLVLRDIDRRSRQRAELESQDGGIERLLQRDYHPRSRSRRHRRIAELSLACVAASTVVVLGLAGVFSSGGRTPVHHAGTIRTASFTLPRTPTARPR